MCDVDHNHLEAAVKEFTKDGKAPSRYRDFRKVLDREDIDVIVHATPDHWHTLINMAAAAAGKDIYARNRSP